MCRVIWYREDTSHNTKTNRPDKNVFKPSDFRKYKNKNVQHISPYVSPVWLWNLWMSPELQFQILILWDR
jgi:hypothetical protein